MTDSLPFSYVLNEKLSILVVDDDPVQCEFCKVYLAEPLVAITAVHSAEDALELLKTEQFDAALVDVDMPGMNGIELVRCLRAQPRFANMPIMVITGREDVGSIDQAYQAGATTFMCKPVNWRLLSYHIRFMIRPQNADTQQCLAS